MCRALLGFAEAGGVPATGKGFAMYLHPEDRATGAALSQVGLTVGSMAAPTAHRMDVSPLRLAVGFVVSGALGFLWIPVWLGVARKAPVLPDPHAVRGGRVREMLRDRTLSTLVSQTSWQ